MFHILGLQEFFELTIIFQTLVFVWPLMSLIVFVFCKYLSCVCFFTFYAFWKKLVFGSNLQNNYLIVLVSNMLNTFNIFFKYTKILALYFKYNNIINIWPRFYDTYFKFKCSRILQLKVQASYTLNRFENREQNWKKCLFCILKSFKPEILLTFKCSSNKKIPTWRYLIQRPNQFTFRHNIEKFFFLVLL